MIIKNAERTDLARILAIQKEAYLSEARIYDDFTLPPLRQTLEELQSEFAIKTILKAEIDGRIVGSIRVGLSGDTCSIERLIVEPSEQGRGIGSALLRRGEAIFATASRYELFTGAKSDANIRLYGRHGYSIFRTQAISPAVSLVFMEKMNRGGPPTSG